jgi:hypothetical protein
LVSGCPAFALLGFIKANVLYIGRQDFQRVSLPEAKQQVCYFIFLLCTTLLLASTQFTVSNTEIGS